MITKHSSVEIKPNLPALAVDAACSGNPGILEFRGVIADTGTMPTSAPPPNPTPLLGTDRTRILYVLM